MILMGKRIRFGSKKLRIEGNLVDENSAPPYMPPGSTLSLYPQRGETDVSALVVTPT